MCEGEPYIQKKIVPQVQYDSSKCQMLGAAISKFFGWYSGWNLKQFSSEQCFAAIIENFTTRLLN